MSYEINYVPTESYHVRFNQLMDKIDSATDVFRVPNKILNVVKDLVLKAIILPNKIELQTYEKSSNNYYISLVWNNLYVTVDGDGCINLMEARNNTENDAYVLSYIGNAFIQSSYDKFVRAMNNALSLYVYIMGVYQYDQNNGCYDIYIPNDRMYSLMHCKFSKNGKLLFKKEVYLSRDRIMGRYFVYGINQTFNELITLGFNEIHKPINSKTLIQGNTYNVADLLR